MAVGASQVIRPLILALLAVPARGASYGRAGTCRRAAASRDSAPTSCRSRCSCCGAEGFNARGCSCRGGKSHVCLKQTVKQVSQATTLRVQRERTFIMASNPGAPDLKPATVKPDEMVTTINACSGTKKPGSKFECSVAHGDYSSVVVEGRCVGNLQGTAGIERTSLDGRVSYEGEVGVKVDVGCASVGAGASVSTDGDATIFGKAQLFDTELVAGVDLNGDRFASVGADAFPVNDALSLVRDAGGDLVLTEATLKGNASVVAQERSAEWYGEKLEYTESTSREGQLYSSSRKTWEGAQQSLDIEVSVKDPRLQIGVCGLSAEHGDLTQHRFDNIHAKSRSVQRTQEAELFIGKVKRSSKIEATGNTTESSQRMEQTTTHTSTDKIDITDETRRLLEECRVSKSMETATQRKVTQYSETAEKFTDTFFESRRKTKTTTGAKTEIRHTRTRSVKKTISKKKCETSVQVDKAAKHVDASSRTHAIEEFEGIFTREKTECITETKNGKTKVTFRSKSVKPSEHVEASASGLANTTAALGTRAVLETIKNGRTDITLEMVGKEGVGAAVTSGASSVMSKGLQKALKCPNATAGVVAMGASTVQNFDALTSSDGEEQKRAMANIARDGAQTYLLSKAPAALGAKCAGSAGAVVQMGQSLFSASEKLANGDGQGAAKDVASGTAKAAGTYAVATAVGGPAGFVAATVFSVAVDFLFG